MKLNFTSSKRKLLSDIYKFAVAIAYVCVFLCVFVCVCVCPCVCLCPSTSRDSPLWNDAKGMY